MCAPETPHGVMQKGCKEQGNQRQAVSHNILASISEESGNSTFKLGLPGHYEGIFKKTTGFDHFLKDLLV